MTRIDATARAIPFLLLTGFLLLAPAGPASGQLLDDLRLFGYFQGRFVYSYEEGISTHPDPVEKTNFTLQQLNLLFGKDFGSNFSAFANLELTNSFSSRDTWGSLKLEEAWMRYNHSRAFNIKAGLQIPIFNNLNEIKNRTPLLPYIVRPSVYESSLSELVPNAVFVPQQAFIQVYGTVPIRGVRLDYAAYAGNQDAFITSTAVGSATAGADTTIAKLVGGRVGLRYGSLKLGVSGTRDHDNLSFLRLGSVARNRLGADLSFTARRFFFESELIALFHNPSDIQQDFLDLIASQTPELGNNLDKLFYYVLVGYHITDQWFVYAYRDYMKDNTFDILAGGYKVYSGGGGFKPIDPIVIKLQYLHARANSGLSSYNGHHVLGAVSVLF